jgi:hypothetical protein
MPNAPVQREGRPKQGTVLTMESLMKTVPARQPGHAFDIAAAQRA